MRRTWMRTLTMAAMTLGLAAQAHAHSGHMDWGNWSFDWEVRDGAGLGIRNVRYKNELVIYKASMPVIRVKYQGDGCGPYADRIDWDSLLEISNCDDKKFCVRTFNSGGHQWLQIGVLAAIGSYRLNQRWWFTDDGWMQAALSSRGLQCELDHWHHPYWRLDFDIAGASGDQVFVFDNNRPDEGWGAGWHKYSAESNQVKNAGTDRKWFVRDNPTGHGMWVLPGDDGTADGFSNKDVAPRLYRYGEDAPWAFGASGHLGYQNGENIAEKDVVLWYVSHMEHHESEGGDQWHRTGPWFLVAR